MTISEDVRARIRRLYFAEHWRIGTIATELGLHHETVERAVGVEKFIRPDARFKPVLLDPYKGFIAEVLDKHPRLRGTRIFDMLKARGYQGSAVQLRRYLRKVRPAARAEAYLRLSTLPGEQAQVDWGSFGKIKVSAARTT